MASTRPHDATAEAVLHVHYSRQPGERAATLARVARAAAEGRAPDAVHAALRSLARALGAKAGRQWAKELEAAEEAVLEAWEAQLS